MKKYLVFILILAIVLSLSACSTKVEKGEKPSVVVTIFPIYDWVKNIAGDSVEITPLLDNGVDLHSYQPTADDMVKIAACDMFIYVGGESDEWVEDALEEKVNDDMVVINLLEALGDGAKEEETVEGMQEKDHDHDHGEDDHGEEDHGEEHDHDEEHELDEHIWLSLRNSAALSGEIASGLEALTGESYSEELEAYTSALRELDDKYTAAVNGGKVKTVLFGDRFPFRYLTDDYGLSYYAAFAGCSAETEASFETVIFLADKVDELGIRAVLTIESSDGRIAETIIENTASKNAKVLRLDSMQSTTSKDIEAGASYVGIMEKNLEVLKEALG